MNVIHPTVHPIEAPPVTDAANNAIPRGRMKDMQGTPGTPGGLALRFFQFAFALVALCVMATTTDFPSVTAFRYLVATVSLQSLWSLTLAILDAYAILVRRRFRHPRVVSLFAIGDGTLNIFDSKVLRNLCFLMKWKQDLRRIIASNITSTLTFTAACASAGITVLIGNDLNDCARNHCTRFETATAMAFMSWFAVSPSFLLNFWTLASK
uniref:CASP-like protein n=1 Tax=Quercus lobata TaxID=97700 RepID=A0A7N2MG73_QUELO